MTEPDRTDDGLREATPAQHVGRPIKAAPAVFTRNGILETCQCLECRVLARAARTAPQAHDTEVGPSRDMLEHALVVDFIQRLAAPPKPAPDGPITTEQLDKLQFGRSLHARPPAPDAPGHTDLMVSPENLDAFMEKNPLPAPDALREALKRIKSMALLSLKGQNSDVLNAIVNIADEGLLSAPVQSGGGTEPVMPFHQFDHCLSPSPAVAAEPDICPYCDSDMEKTACSQCGRERVDHSTGDQRAPQAPTREAIAETLKRKGFTSRDGTVIHFETFAVIDAVLEHLRLPQVCADLIEQCARVAEAQAQAFLSPQYASNQPFGSLCERFACEEVAKAIRALAVPSTDCQSPTEGA